MSLCCGCAVLHDANLAKWVGYNSTWGYRPDCASVQDPIQKPDYAKKHKHFYLYLIYFSQLLPKLSTVMINL